MISKSKYIVYGLIICLASSSCRNETHREKKETRTVFRYNESAGISSLDPAFAKNVENIWAVNQLFNGLLQLDSGLHINPCIANSWEVSSDGLVYTFHLRNDVYFHDHPSFPGGKGRKVNASDFVYSYSRIIDDKIASPGAWIFNNVDKNIGYPFRAVDDNTFQVILAVPYPPFLWLTTMQYCSVVPKEITELYGRDFRNNPIGTGPFKFKLWKEGVNLIFSKNENYFEKDENGKRLPYLDAVSISFLSDEQTAFIEFLKGDLDFLSGLDEFPIDEVLTQTGMLRPDYEGKFRMDKQSYLKTDYLGILVDEDLEIVKNSPLRKRAIRKAINYAIDRKKIITYLRNSVGMPANSGFVPHGMPSFNAEEVKGYTYDQEKAKELLFEAGFPDGKGLSEITLSTAIDHLDMCEAIQAQLGEVGIKVKIDVNPAVTQSELVAKSAINLFRKSWVADYADAENFLALFYGRNFSPEGPNYTHFKNAMFDKLYEKALQETNSDLRNNYYRQMDQIIMDEAPVVVLYYDEVLRFVQKNVAGLPNNPMNLLTLKTVSKKAE